MRIVITGATGLLGSNLLLEIIKQNLKSLDSLEIIILGRDKEGVSLTNRIRNICLGEEGLSYIDGNVSLESSLEDFLSNNLRVISIDLDEEGLGINYDELIFLKSKVINLFFHLASLTDFRSTPLIVQMLERSNVKGTESIIHLIESLQVQEFIYVSSAYVSGFLEGALPPDCIDLNIKFRNAYEFSKLKAEILVREFSRRTSIRCRYFRPSTICGRLIENPKGYINKFDVFYSWAAWFLRLKQKKKIDLYSDNLDLDLRLCFNKRGGLNIVPADFIAKVMYAVCLQNDPGESYYLVSDQETLHEVYFNYILRFINVSVEFVEEIPKNKNEIETFYYKTVGLIFTPYAICNPIQYDSSNLTNVLNKSKLSSPPINSENFEMLLNFAKKFDFGLSPNFKSF